MKKNITFLVSASALLLVGAGCSLIKTKTVDLPAVPKIQMEQGNSAAIESSLNKPETDVEPAITFGSTTLYRVSEKNSQEPIELAANLPYTLEMAVVDQEWGSPSTTVNVSVPQMIYVTNPTKALAFNDLINQKTDQITTEFLQQVADWDNDNVPTTEQTNFIEVAVFARLTNAKLLSLVFEVNTFYAGSAHPNRYTRSFNYDLEQNKELSLADLFVPNKSFLKKLSQVTIAAVKTTPNDHGDILERDQKWLSDGAGPDEINFHTVTVSPEGFYIQFDPYDIDAYAAGETEVLIPYKQLDGYVSPRVITAIK